MKPPHYKVFYDKRDKLWYWKLVARNNKPMAVSPQGYTTKATCLRTILAVSLWAKDASVVA